MIPLRARSSQPAFPAAGSAAAAPAGGQGPQGGIQAAAATLLGLIGMSCLGQQMVPEVTEPRPRPLRPGFMRMLPGMTVAPRPAILPPQAEDAGPPAEAAGPAAGAAGPPGQTPVLALTDLPEVERKETETPAQLSQMGAGGTTPPAGTVEEVAEELRRVRETKNIKRPAAATAPEKSAPCKKAKAVAKSAPCKKAKAAAEAPQLLASAKGKAKKAEPAIRRPAAAVGKGKRAAGPQLKLGCRRCRGSHNGCEQCRRKSYGGQRMDRTEWLKVAKKEGLK